MGVSRYEVDENFIIYDSPGLGDGEKDRAHTQKIQGLLQEYDSNGNALIDLVLVIIDGGVERDLESTYKSIAIVSRAMNQADRERILVAVNKCDICSNPKAQLTTKKLCQMSF